MSDSKLKILNLKKKFLKFFKYLCVKVSYTKDKVLTFEQALLLSDSDPSNRHILMGNGFSALFPKILDYQSLLEAAKFDEASELEKCFTAFDTNNFEFIIKKLSDAKKVVQICAKDEKTVLETICTHEEKLKEIFRKTIIDNHPKPSLLETKSCAKFLHNFEYFYTLNYDLLLYWVIMKKNLKKSDGFGKPKSENHLLTWVGKNEQKVFYLHGALHFFDKDGKIRKHEAGDQNLISKVKGGSSLIVSEGTSDEKRKYIDKSVYLNFGIKSLKNREGTLFIHGCSLAENDAHIFEAINKSNIEKIWVSVFTPTDKDDKESRVIREKFKLKAKSLFYDSEKIKLGFYDASSAHVWDREDKT